MCNKYTSEFTASRGEDGVIAVRFLGLESVIGASVLKFTVLIGLKLFDAVLEEGVSDHLSDESGKFEGEVNGLNSGITTPLDLVVVVLVLSLVAVANESNALQEKDASESDDVGPHDSSSDVREDNMHSGNWDKGKSPEEEADGPHSKVTKDSDEFGDSPPCSESTDGGVISDDEVPVELIGVVDEVSHGHHSVTKPGEGSSVNQGTEGIVQGVVGVLELRDNFVDVALNALLAHTFGHYIFKY